MLVPRNGAVPKTVRVKKHVGRGIVGSTMPFRTVRFEAIVVKDHDARNRVLPTAGYVDQLLLL